MCESRLGACSPENVNALRLNLEPSEPKIASCQYSKFNVAKHIFDFATEYKCYMIATSTK